MITNRKKRTHPHPFGAALLAVIKSTGKSLYRVAKNAGKPSSQLSQLVKGKSAPEVDTLIWLAAAMEIRPEDLFAVLIESLEEEARLEAENREHAE